MTLNAGFVMGLQTIARLVLLALCTLAIPVTTIADFQPQCSLSVTNAFSAAQSETTVHVALKTIEPQPSIEVSSISLALAIASEQLSVTGISTMPDLDSWQHTTYELQPVDHPDYSHMLLLHAAFSTDSTQTVAVDSLALWQLQLRLAGTVPPGTTIEIPFIFTSCTDNLVMTTSRDTALMPLQVLTSSGTDITDFSNSMPTVTGPASDCFDWTIDGHTVPVPAIVLRAGAISTAGADSTLIGDIDLDHQACQPADLNLLCRFFQYGDSVFTIDHTRQIAASDVNQDQIDTTLTDLVALRYRTIDVPLPGSPPPIIYHGQFTYTLIEPGQLLLSLRSDCSIGAYNLWLSTLGAIVDSVVFLHDQDPGQLGCHVAEPHAARLRILGIGGTTDNPWIDSWNTELAVIHYQGMTPQPIIERLAAADLSSIMVGEFTDTPPDQPILPDVPYLSANYPNPFNPTTRIDFYLPRRTAWQLSVYDITGRTIRSLKGSPALGWVSVQWDGRTSGGEPAASGVYLYRLQAANWSDSRKMILLK